MRSARQTLAFLALDFDEAIEQVGADAQSAFDQANIFVARAKKAFNALVDLNACFHLSAKGNLHDKSIRFCGRVRRTPLRRGINTSAYIITRDDEGWTRGVEKLALLVENVASC